jgi:sulfite exporter TauE/SafE
MVLEETTLIGAFTLGLAHTLEPCEDKAVVSLYTLWGSKRWAEGVFLVVLYGLGMALIDTVLGLVFAYLGASILMQIGGILRVVAGAITVVFGLFMILGAPHIHLIHHHDGVKEEAGMSSNFNRMTILALGLVRGLPPCPFELAILLWAASMGNILAGTLTVFVFGLGTTAGLIPLGVVMGGVAGVARRTSYGRWIPKICGLAMIGIGLVLAVAPLLGIEL